MAGPRVQRRLAAILAADVVGYSRMMEADEAGTLARLKALRADFLHPKVAEYGGRIVKTTGDGTLVEFPSVVDAVQHAIDVQTELARRGTDEPEDRRISLRVGINVGDIIIDGDDIFGDGVNIAARLEGLAEPGGLCLSGMAHEGVRKRLDVDFEDLGEQSFKNIAEPVRVYRVSISRPSGDSKGRGVTDAIFRRPAVAVLPFDNLSGNPEEDFFADGLTEDLITVLSLLKWFPVIARNSVFIYKNKAHDLRQIGKELSARYLIEGSVRKAGDRVRVTAQLINAETGHHVWAERYDRNLDDIFDLQEEISNQIAGTIEPELHRAEQDRLTTRNPASLNAWELFHRGLTLFYGSTAADMAAARDMFARALKLDPTYARACAFLAFTHHADLWLEYTSSREESLAQLIQLSRRAVTLDASDGFAHMMCSLAATWLKDHDIAIVEAQEALRLNPSSSEMNTVLGAALGLACRPEEAISALETALRLSPRDPNRARIQTILARSQATAGRLEAAVETARQAIARQPNMMEARLILISSLAHLGRQTEAEVLLRQAKELQPEGVTIPESWSRYAEPATREKLVEGMRKAGWED